MITQQVYESKIKALMAKWKKSHEKNANVQNINFIDDGIVNPEKWFNPANKQFKGKKILFLLKEAYSKDDEKASWPLTDWLRTEHPIDGKHKIWKRVVEWTYALVNTNSKKIPKFSEKEIKDNYNEYLENIAVVNIKKSCGKSNSNMGEILKYAEQDKDFLSKEIELIDPDIIVCGYSIQALMKVFDLKIKENSGYYSENWFYVTDEIFGKKRIILDFYHPSNHYPILLNYYSLACIYQQALLEVNSKD